MENNYQLIRTVVLEFLLFACIASIPFLALYIDLFYLENMVEEESVVEYTQSFCLIMMIIFFFRIAIKIKEKRSGFILITGFLLCMFIREQDNLFDNLFFHGSWFYFALPTAVICILYALRNYNSLIPGLKSFITSKEYSVFLLGLVIILITSRLLGMGRIWEYVLGLGYVRTAKHIIEECSELFGYCFMLFSVFRFTCKFKK